MIAKFYARSMDMKNFTNLKMLCKAKLKTYQGIFKLFADFVEYMKTKCEMSYFSWFIMNGKYMICSLMLFHNVIEFS